MNKIWFVSLVAIVFFAGCEEQSRPSYECDPLASTPAFAVLRSDFASTAIALLDENGCVLDPSWVHSGSVLPGLTAALSGDVLLATNQPMDFLTVVDRGNQVVTRFELEDKDVVGQVVTHGDDPPQAIFTNPYDVAQLSNTSAWISRYGFGTDESDPEDGGWDLLQFNPSTMALTGTIIDLNQCDDEELDCSAPARPAFMAQLGNYLVVSLNRISEDFQSAGTGAVAIVNMNNMNFEVHEFAGLKNCLDVVPVPGTTDTVLVTCSGFANPFGDEAQLRATSGVIYLQVESDDGAVSELARFEPSSNNALPLAVVSAQPLSLTEFVAIDFGGFSPASGDRVYQVTIGNGDPELVYESGAFELGIPSFDVSRNLLLVSDANTTTGGIVRFAYDTGTLTKIDTMPIEATLPARNIVRLQH